MRSLVILISFTLYFTACKKNDIGGDADVVCYVKHHSSPINNATIYIKFDASELPSDIISNYDLKVQGNPSNNEIRIEGLRYGEYFIYAEGFDPGLMDDVRGGVPLEIKYRERHDEISLDVQVTE